MQPELPAHIQQFVSRFCAAHPEHASAPILHDSFGDSPQMADELVALVLDGTKTASCSSRWQWDYDNEEPLAPGTLAVITDGDNQPRCILETTEATEMPFDAVDAQFAADEGEGDRSYGYWRTAHIGFFSRTLPRIGREFDEMMPVVCERFRVLYKEG